MTISETFWLTVVSMIQYSCIVISVVLFLFLPKSGRQQYIEFGLILIASLISETIGWVGIFVFHTNMNLAPSILTFFYLPLTVLLYRKLIDWPSRNLIFFTVIIVFEIFAAINLFFIQGISGINSFSRALASFIYIVLTITYLFGYLLEIPRKDRIKLPMYWITVAFLAYNCVVIYIIIWIDYFLKVMKSNLIEISMIHNSIGIGYYVIFFYALYLIRSQHILRTSNLN